MLLKWVRYGRILDAQEEEKHNIQRLELTLQDRSCYTVCSATASTILCLLDCWHRLALKWMYSTTKRARRSEHWHTTHTLCVFCLLTQHRVGHNRTRRWRRVSRPLTHCRQQTMNNCPCHCNYFDPPSLRAHRACVSKLCLCTGGTGNLRPNACLYVSGCCLAQLVLLFFLFVFFFIFYFVFCFCFPLTTLGAMSCVLETR